MTPYTHSESERVDEILQKYANSLTGSPGICYTQQEAKCEQVLPSIMSTGRNVPWQTAPHLVYFLRKL